MTTPKPGTSASERAHYSREEMEAILQRALQKQQTKSDGVSHDELLAAAAEIGIPPEDIEAAAGDLAGDSAKKEAIEAAREQRNRRLRARFFGWAMMSLVAIGICAITGAHWWIWPVGIGGFILAMRTMRAFAFQNPNELPRVRESRRERRLRKQEERIQAEEQRRQLKLREFERKVAIGTDAVVRVLETARGASGQTSKGSKINGSSVAAGAKGGVRVDPVASGASEKRARIGVDLAEGRDVDEIDDEMSESDSRGRSANIAAAFGDYVGKRKGG